MADQHLTEGTANLPPPPAELFAKYARTAPNFNEAENRLLDSVVRQQTDLEGPIARASIPVVTLFDSKLPHQANQTTINDKFEVQDAHGLMVRGKLELHYGADGQPASARFTDQYGNVEELKVDQKDPTKLAEDHYDYRQIGATADFQFEDGHVTHQSIVNKDSSSTTIDQKDGIHYRFEVPEAALILSEDHSGKSMEYSASQATIDQHKDDPAYIVHEKFEYNDPLSDTQPSAITLTRENGEQFRAVPAANGAWQVSKLEPK